MPCLEYKSVTKTEWIKAVKRLLKDNPGMMPKGVMCKKCGKPAFFVNWLDGTSYCVECKADETFEKTSSIRMLLPTRAWEEYVHENLKQRRGNEYCFVIKDADEPQDDSIDRYDQEQHRAAAEARGCV